MHHANSLVQEFELMQPGPLNIRIAVTPPGTFLMVAKIKGSPLLIVYFKYILLISVDTIYFIKSPKLTSFYLSRVQRVKNKHFWYFF